LKIDILRYYLIKVFFIFILCCNVGRLTICHVLRRNDFLKRAMEGKIRSNGRTRKKKEAATGRTYGNKRML